MAPDPSDHGSPSRRFSAAELERWRRRLLELRREAVTDLIQLARDDREDADQAEAGSHPPDLAPTLRERELIGDAALAGEAHVREIDAALRRIETGEPVPFGICEATGAPIEYERLELMPWTPVSVAGAASTGRRDEE